MKSKKLLGIGLVAFAFAMALSFTGTAQADQIVDLTATGIDPVTGAFTDDITLDVSSTFSADPFDPALSGFAVLSETGFRQTPTNPDDVTTGLFTSNASYNIDNFLVDISGQFGFDNDGLGFTTASGLFVDIYQLGNPFEPPYVESIIPADSPSHYDSGDVLTSITFTRTGVSVPDGGNTSLLAALAAAGLVGCSLLRKRSTQAEFLIPSIVPSTA